MPEITPEATPPVTHNPQAGRFQLIVEGQPCVLDYRESAGIMTFTHTGVPRDLEGRGLAGRLVKFGLEYAREHKLKVRSRCSYVDVYLKRHPEYQDLIAS